MSSTDYNVISKPDQSGFKRFDIPVKMGILIGLIVILIDTVNYKMALGSSMMAFYGLYFVSGLFAIIMYGVTGARQRKAMGGYINIKEAFQAIFIAILISTAIISVWGVIYVKWIDPDFMMRMKEQTISFMQRMNAPQEKVDEVSASIDKELKNSLTIGAVIYGYAKKLILYSIAGLICAAIVKKDPPAEMR